MRVGSRRWLGLAGGRVVVIAAALALCATSSAKAGDVTEIVIEDGFLRGMLCDTPASTGLTPRDIALTCFGVRLWLPHMELVYSLGNNSPLPVESLVGLEYAVNLREISIPQALVSDLTPLADLEQLSWVDFNHNCIGDLSPLANKTAMEVLVLDGNRVADVSALAGMVDLWWLHLADNQIQDISALAGLTELSRLYLNGNPLNAEAYETYLPMIEANNPGIDLRYDPFVTRGDADMDGDVDLEDFIMLKAGFGSPGTWYDGDFNGDGSVDLDDFIVLKTQFGPANVPEPGCLSLLAVGTALVARRRR